jgi:phosphate transport system permease protein
MKRQLIRKITDRAFTAAAYAAVGVMCAVLLALLAPIFIKGAGAYFFRGTAEYRRMMYAQFNRGNAEVLEAEWKAVSAARAPVYAALDAFGKELPGLPAARRRELRPAFRDVQEEVETLFGSRPGEPLPALTRKIYGQTRWEKAREARDAILYETAWDYSGETAKQVKTERAKIFAGTALAPLFPLLRDSLAEMMRPHFTFYGRFLTDNSIDAHFFGGIGPETLGTLYLAIGAMLLAIPFGVAAAVYFREYAHDGPVVSFLRSCVNTLAGVPSVVFGLFGLAFFINTLHISEGKSVLVGSLTLALLTLPTVIRASEEAIAAVPATYKEAALALGAGTGRTILTVILPAALPGILTGIVISMGRAVGETAPIIFTAAVSVGKPLGLGDLFSQPTPALSWNLYNLCTEHEAIDAIRHVQYGMAATLILLVLLLNLGALMWRARISKNLKG